MEKKYTALRVLTWLFRVIAVVTFVLGIGLGVLEMVTPSFNFDYDNAGNIKVIPGPPETVLGLGFILGSLLLGLALYAFGELLHLFMDIEENTRKTAILLQQRQLRSTTPLKGAKDTEDEPPMSAFANRKP